MFAREQCAVVKSTRARASANHHRHPRLCALGPHCFPASLLPGISVTCHRLPSWGRRHRQVHGSARAPMRFAGVCARRPWAEVSDHFPEVMPAPEVPWKSEPSHKVVWISEPAGRFEPDFAGRDLQTVSPA